MERKTNYRLISLKERRKFIVERVNCMGTLSKKKLKGIPLKARVKSYRKSNEGNTKTAGNFHLSVESVLGIPWKKRRILNGKSITGNRKNCREFNFRRNEFTEGSWEGENDIQ